MWLITGGKGQLGIAIGKALEKQSIEYISLGSAQLDICNVNQIHEIFLQYKPTVVVNTAAWTDVDGAEENENLAFAVNATGVANIALASKEVGATLVHISTDYVFSGNGSQPWKEDAPHSPLSAYGRSKAAGEKSVQDVYPEGSYIVRTAWLYSPWGKNFAKTMQKLALANENEIKVVSDQIGQPTSAISLAEQIVILIKSAAPFGIYHGTNSGQASWYEFAQEIFLALGADASRVKPIKSTEYKQIANRPSYSVLSHEHWRKTNILLMPEWKSQLIFTLKDLEFKARDF
jgi:dTDP-4-dehydrorhamnose reductase